MRRRQARRRARYGAATVELAVMLSMLIMLVFLCIEFASVFYIRHNMVRAARAGARTLAVQDGTADQARASVARSLEDFHNVNFTISITEPADGNPVDRDVIVQITAPLGEAALGDPYGWFGDVLISSSVTMRKEG